MPTDDDYGRRERFLLHQHGASQYGTPPSASPVPSAAATAAAINNSQLSNCSNPVDCYLKQATSSSNNAASYQLQCDQQHQQDLAASISKASDNSRYSQSPHQYRSCQKSDRCSSRYEQQQQRSHHHDRLSAMDHCNNNPEHLGLVVTTTTTAASAIISDYANASSVLGSASNNPFTPDSFPSPPSPAPANDRFVPPPPLSPTGGNNTADKYSSSQSLAGFPLVDRILPPDSPKSSTRFATAPASPKVNSSKDRYASAERLLVGQSASQEPKDTGVPRYSDSSTERLLSASPIMGNLPVVGDYGKDSTAIGKSSRFGISAERLITSSPIHAPVPERFSGKSCERLLGESPIHERYYGQENPTAGGAHHSEHSRYQERFHTSSPNPEGSARQQQQRYSFSTDRQLLPGTTAEQSRRFSVADRIDSNSCQDYAEGSSSTGSPPMLADYGNSRFSNFQDSSTGGQSRYSTSDRFSDLAIQRYGQSRSTERFGDRYMGNSSSPAHDSRSVELSRTTSSTERLLVSCSPSSTESNRYHYTTGVQSSFELPSPNVQNSTSSNSNRNNVSGYQSKGTCDKYLQVSKSMQSYPSDRFQSTQDQYDKLILERYDARFSGGGGGGNPTGDRFPASASDFFNTDRFSPARAAANDKYLTLGHHPVDRYSSNGQRGNVMASSTGTSSSNNDRSSYGGVVPVSSGYVPPTAHTPVERYVPQPPPEVLYPDRYVDRYMAGNFGGQSDGRYGPTSDPGDPYSRRDLSFHGHFRLPPPGYPYHHQSHYRFRGFAYTASPGARIGGSPGSSSSSSSNSVQRDGFSTSPLLRPKARASTIEFTGGERQHACNGGSCCSESAAGHRGACCQQNVRRSMPPGTLPTIPTQSSHSSW